MTELPFEADEPTQLEPPPRRKSRARVMVSRLLLAFVGVAVAFEILLQLPPVRHAVRRRAEAALQEKIPGATIASCAALDVTGVARFDGVSLPAGGAHVVLDGLEVALSLSQLIFEFRVVPTRIAAEDVTVRAGGMSFGPAPGAHFGLEIPEPARLLEPPRALPSPSPREKAKPKAGPPTLDLLPGDVRATLGGTAAVCRDRVTAAADAAGMQDDGERHCAAGAAHAEIAISRSPTLTVARFLAFGDSVRVLAEGEHVLLPPLAAHGVIEHAKGGRTTLQSQLSVGPRGTVDTAIAVADGDFTANVDATTDSFLGLVESLPLDLFEVRALGVDGPVKAHARAAGPLADPASWQIDMHLDLAQLRAKSRAAGAGARLRAPFTFLNSADPDAPAIRMDPDNPDFVPLAALPNHVWRAILLCEDSDFFTHSGFDSEAIVNAFKQNLKADRIRRGGSTITQQLAKNFWLSRDRTFRRKLEEALLTITLEAAVPKERLLEIYVNAIEWGPGIYGLRPAARHYFGKDATKLSPKEAAFLATIIPNPRYYYVYYRRGELTDRWEQNVMVPLTKMHETGELSDAEYSVAADTKLKFTSSKPDAWSNDASTGAP